MDKITKVIKSKKPTTYVDSIESSRKIMKLLGVDKDLIDKWTNKEPKENTKGFSR